MGDILRRRGMMRLASGEVSSPLYPLKLGTTSVSGHSVVVSDTNHIVQTKSSSTNSYFYSTSANSKIESRASVYSSTWFSLSAGDVLVLKIKNISYSIGSSFDSVLSFGLKDSGGNTIISGGSNISLEKGTSGTLVDRTNTVTLSSNKNVTCLLIYDYRPSTFEYDIEFWVNDVRYF